MFTQFIAAVFLCTVTNSGLFASAVSLSPCEKIFFNAVEQCDPMTVSWLLQEKVVDVNTRDEDDYTALHRAVNVSNNNACINVLLCNGASVNAQTPEGETPLMLAVQANELKYVILLINKGADPSIADFGGTTPLMMASRTCHLALYLINHGADIFAQDKYDQTVMHFAVCNHNIFLISLLMHKGLIVDETCRAIAPQAIKEVVAVLLDDVTSLVVKKHYYDKCYLCKNFFNNRRVCITLPCCVRDFCDECFKNIELDADFKCNKCVRQINPTHFLVSKVYISEAEAEDEQDVE